MIHRNPSCQLAQILFADFHSVSIQLPEFRAARAVHPEQRRRSVALPLITCGFPSAQRPIDVLRKERAVRRAALRHAPAILGIPPQQRRRAVFIPLRMNRLPIRRRADRLRFQHLSGCRIDAPELRLPSRAFVPDQMRLQGFNGDVIINDRAVRRFAVEIDSHHFVMRQRDGGRQLLPLSIAGQNLRADMLVRRTVVRVGVAEEETAFLARIR